MGLDRGCRCSFHVSHVIFYDLENIEVLVARFSKGFFNVSKIGLKLVGRCQSPLWCVKIGENLRL